MAKLVINNTASSVVNKLDDALYEVETLRGSVSNWEERVQGLEKELDKTERTLQQETEDIRQHLHRVEMMQYQEHQMFRDGFTHLDERLEIYAAETHHDIRELKRERRKLLIVGSVIVAALVALMFFI